LENTTIASNTASYNGGGIYGDVVNGIGTTTLVQVTVSGNRATGGSGYGGGGLRAGAIVVVQDARYRIRRLPLGS
jgi:predicted outer membrane repeat protein